MKWFFLAVLILGLVPLSFCAGDPAASIPPLPSGPLLNRAPDSAQWTITITEAPLSAPGSPETGGGSGQASGASPISLAKILTTKAEKIYLEDTTEASGSRRQVWSIGSYKVLLPPGDSIPILSLGGASAMPSVVDFARADFSCLGWISPVNYAGVGKIEGHACLIFKGSVDDELQWGHQYQPGAPERKISAEADIDIGTRLPVLLRLAAETRSYQFQDASSTALTVPPEVQKVIKAWENHMAIESQMPARP